MVDVFLIIFTVVTAVLLLVGIIYLMIVFISKEDRNQAWLPKIIVCFSLLLACFTVLLLPLDVANRASPYVNQNLGELVGRGLNMPLVWQILLCAIIVMLLVILPFTIFYYESWDPEAKTPIGQWKAGIAYTLITIIVFALLVIIGWFAAGKAAIPYASYTMLMNVPDPKTTPDPIVESLNLEIDTSIFVFAIGVLTMLGWFFFGCFGAVGLAGLPMDLILGFVHRPRPMELVVFTKKKMEVAAKSDALIAQGTKLVTENEGSKTPGRATQKKMFEWRKKVKELDDEWTSTKTAYEQGGESPFLSLLRLVAGILSSVISLMWVVHIIVNNAAHVHPFLNSFFTLLADFWSLAGLVAYAFFTLYLLWCTVKGVILCSSRMFIIEIHPMKPNETLMSSFLFNCFIILLASVVVTQFAAASFRTFAARTAVDSMFSVYLANMKFVGWAMQYFQYVFLGIAGLTFFVLIIGRSTGKLKT